MTHHFTVSTLTTMAMLFLTMPAFAQEISAPTGDVILTITGDIDVTNVGQTLQFDLATLSKLTESSFDTSTNWTDGVHRFQGVSLHTLTELLGLTQGTLHATATNDYTVKIPVTDAQPDGPIIAYTIDGAVMSVREKGPLWVVYPYDNNHAYRTDVIYSRSIWQLDRIEVLK